MAKISYDKDSHIISIRFKNKKSVDSDVQDNIVIDYDQEGAIINLDIMGVSMDEFTRPYQQMIRAASRERTLAA
jgi:uncharacterized protein YuzE